MAKILALQAGEDGSEPSGVTVGATNLAWPNGRAADCYSEMWRFDSSRESHGVLAQVVRALPCHGRGHGFKSRRSRSAPMVKRRSCQPTKLVVEVRVLPGALYVLVAQWIARVVPNHEVGRSNRPEDTARDSPGERRSAKPPDGFDSRRLSTRRRPRADEGCSR